MNLSLPKSFYVLAIYCIELEVLTLLIVFVYNGNSIDVDIRKHLFTKRVVTDLNRLPREVVDAPNLPVFKRHLNKAFNNMI